jgi:hypothetical protein
MNNTIKFSFTMRVPVPVPAHNNNDKAEIDISVVGFCEYDVDDPDFFGRQHLTPCSITAFMCPNCQTDTPPSAWTPVQTSDDGRDQKGFKEFYDAIEYEINQAGTTISEYEETVIAYFTQSVKVEEITTYEAAH